MNQRSAAGDEHGYVGEIIDPDWHPNDEPAERVSAPITPALKHLPEPGIYFGMPEDEYHAVHAVSSSAVKRMVASTMEYWAYSRLNPDYEEKERPWLDHGKATHCLVLEGEEEYQRRYAVDLDPADFDSDNVLISTDEIKAAIGKHTEMQPVTPNAGGKQALIDQLAELGRAHGVEVNLDGTVPELKTRICAFEEEQPIKPVSRVSVEENGEFSTRSANKPDWIAQLLDIEPDAKIWDHMIDQHLANNHGKTMISAKDDRRVRVAGRMIERHPDAGPLLQGGYAEVSIFWYCPVTGAPMKARIDYLKLRAKIDVKTFSNPRGMPISRAVSQAVANYRYRVQHVVYEQAVKAARQMIAEQGPDCIHQPVDAYDKDVLDWCERWCQIEEPPKFILIFQQSGIAPVTRVRGLKREDKFKAMHRLVEELKYKWVECAKTYGTDPWLDHEPMRDMEDDETPSYETEMENFYD